MYKPSLDYKKMNDIISNTIEAIEKGKHEIFEIAENSRNECRSIEIELDLIKGKASKIILEVDELETIVKKSRQKLMLVSRDFNKYKEEDIKSAYEDAKDYQIKLILKKQEEKDLIKQRSDLERRLKNAYEVVKKAENLVSQVGVAMGYLGGNLKDVFEQLEDIQNKQVLGIRVIKAQEDERQRVAREIHDGPAQSMANVVIKTEICEKLLDRDLEKAKYELNQLKTIVRDCLRDVRKIIYDLRPMSLDDLGLIPTIQRFIINFEEETMIRVALTVTAQDEKIIHSIIKLAVFRIIQESLNNIRKYSKAQNVSIRLEVINKSITLLIIDDGIGFDVENKFNSSKEESGFGLYIMSERVELLKGKIDIQSEKDKGTRIKVWIPLKDEEDYNNDKN